MRLASLSRRSPKTNSLTQSSESLTPEFQPSSLSLPPRKGRLAWATGNEHGVSMFRASKAEARGSEIVNGSKDSKVATTSSKNLTKGTGLLLAPIPKGAGTRKRQRTSSVLHKRNRKARCMKAYPTRNPVQAAQACIIALETKKEVGRGWSPVTREIVKKTDTAPPPCPICGNSDVRVVSQLYEVGWSCLDCGEEYGYPHVTNFSPNVRVSPRLITPSKGLMGMPSLSIGPPATSGKKSL